MAKNSISTMALRRSFVLGVGVIAVFALLMLRILYIQTFEFEKYQAKVIDQMTTRSPVSADRGKIYDRNGNILATNTTTYRVFISPSGIKNAQNEIGTDSNTQYAEIISKGLSEMLDVPYDHIYKQATEYTKYLDRTIKRQVYEETADRLRVFIDENKLGSMVHLEAQSTRYYPGGTLAAHTIGFTSSDGMGLYGIEYQYNEYLKGVDGYYVTARDSYGNEMPYDYSVYVDAVDGYDLTTTIDTTVQNFLEEALQEAVTESNAQNRACGIVMNVKTGAILGMATSSPFDLNDPRTLESGLYGELVSSGLSKDSQSYADFQSGLMEMMWSNKAITELYIPGSTFKIVTSSMALEERVVTLNETLSCSGSLTVLKQKIHCHKVKGHGTLTYAQGLQQSCNVWFMTLGSRVGIERFQKYVNAFGYNEKTGVDLPGEAKGIFASEMTQLDLAIYAFGQNFKVTPIQQISAIAAVANGGELVTPYIVDSISDKSGNVVYRHKTDVKRQVVSESVCKTLCTVLEEGVSGDGGAKNAYVAGYRVAAKTGTSEKKERECPKCGYVGELKEKINEDVYYACTVCKYVGFMDEFKVSEKYICSCVAFAPSDSPEIAIIIIVDEPTKGSLYGSTVAAPYISKALKNILPYLGVEPIYTVEEIENASVKVSNYKGYSVSYAQSLVERAGLKVKVVGSGSKVTSQQPPARSEINKNTGVVVLYTGNEEQTTSVIVPNLVGKTSVAANALLVNLGLNVKIEGAQKHTVGDSVAMVVSQSVAPGTAVSPGTVVTVEFRHMDGDEEPDYLG